MSKHTLMLLGVMICLTGPLGGCVKVVDPTTGETTHYIDPNHPMVPIVESGTETAIGLLPLVGGPVGGVIATALTGLLVYWRKLKPELVASQTAAEQGHAVGTLLATALEDYKEEHPEEWKVLGAKIRSQLDKLGVDAKAAENFIRGLRGLQPKV